MLGRIATVAALAVGGMMLKKKLGPQGQSGEPSFVEDSIEVDVPVNTAYNQWTQFEDFPKFMNHVDEVRQIDETHLRWRARIAGKPTEWDAEITHQIPDRHIAWRSTSGPPNSGAVTFQRIDENRTRVTLRMSYQPTGVVEMIGDAFGAVKMETSGNLRRFAEFLEGRGHETGAWRGSVAGAGTVNPSGTSPGGA